MSLDENDFRFSAGVFDGNIDVAKAALEAGANVNGFPDQPLAPIMIATIAGRVGMVSFLLERGADPDKPVLVDLPSASPGERALHVAARNGKVEIVHLLLEAGADPALTADEGFLPLHFVAREGRMNMVDMLVSRAPATLNLCADMGQTPLILACCGDQLSMVSKLLSLGAMQHVPHPEAFTSPLMMATGKGFVSVARVLINEGRLWDVRRFDGLNQALYMAVQFKRTIILRLLLAAVGKEERPTWANTGDFDGVRLLHSAAGCCDPAAVGILLEAGADETAQTSKGRLPLDLIGVDLGRDGKSEVCKAHHRMDRGREIAIRRMLQRGPAYRARSWAWPSDEEANEARGRRDGDTAGAAAVPSSPPAMKTPSIAGVRIFRPKEKDNNSKLFVRLIGRYCEKD